jgi:hypothetical protein
MRDGDGHRFERARIAVAGAGFLRRLLAKAIVET